jgi:hypothetical protein
VEAVAKETGNEALSSSLGAVSLIILVHGEEKTVSLVPHFLLTQADILHFSLCKGTLCFETADTNA